jgi:DNA-binding transcriptional LysR family regulator
METFELRYFLGVAATENIHSAARRLHVSAPSLSKAISRLEAETGVPLFERIGRGIRLTAEGRLLAERAAAIVHAEEAAKRDLSSMKKKVRLRIGGPEPLLSFANEPRFLELTKGAEDVRFEYLSMLEPEAIDRLRARDLDVAFITRTAGLSDLKSIRVGNSTFVTCAGPGHPLYARAKRKAVIPIREVLAHSFAAPGENLFGDALPSASSPDGWRDDKFPRRIVHITPSLFLLSRMVAEGKSLAYLPDYVVRQLDALPLKISGCPFHCKQDIHAVLREGLRLPTI